MQNELKYTLLPLSARQARSLPVREYSLPSHKARVHNKIKINIKRLPNDFFQSPSSMPQITHLNQIMHKMRAETHEAKRSRIRMQTFNSSHLERRDQILLREGQKVVPAKTEKVRRSPRHHYTETERENTNFMNWTFSRQIYSQQKAEKPKSTPRTLPSEIPTPTRIKISTLQPSYDLTGEQQRKSGAGCKNITTVITDKLAELNVNRLKRNLRRNNHPPMYLQYIKRRCN